MRDTRYEIGSALILAVVLTSLLAIIGVMFVMVARVDKISTSAISENRELNFAVETVVAKISQELVLDVPGAGRPDYYDYPGSEDKWLASLEPYDSGVYKWRQISDVTGYIEKVILGVKGRWGTQDIEVDIIKDREEIKLDSNGNLEDQLADADGDGVADSKWVELEGINSNKGKPIYAAIRVIDNGGMMNVNTAYKFNPNQGRERIDGSSQTQINLAALSQRGSNGSLDNAADNLQYVRCGNGSEPYGEDDILKYERDVVWLYNEPNGAYTPFDISDELKLRNRYILNYNLMVSRIEELWENAYDGGLKVPRTETSQLTDPNGWFWKTNNSSWDVNEYDYRHIATIYNMDRIIDPDGEKKVNINRDNKGLIYGALRKAFSAEPNFAGDVNDVAAQIAVNLIDFRDEDVNDNVTTITVDGKTYYGFEQPCVYISELAHRLKLNPSAVGPPFAIPDDYDMSYAIELYKPYGGDNYPEPNQWQLNIGGYGTVTINNWTGTRRFHVIYFENTNVSLTITFDANDTDPNLPPLSPTVIPIGTGTKVFEPWSLISLQRQVDSDWITVDSVQVPDANGWWDFSGTPHSIHRDIQPHKCIRRLWDSNVRDPNLGHVNSYAALSTRQIQAHPANTAFTNIGEIGMVFRKAAHCEAGQNPYLLSGIIGYSSDSDTEEEVRLDLADPNYHGIFEYLAVFDPTVDGIDNDGDGDGIDLDVDPNELKIPGRININTAPWYVIAQLPWMTPEIAQKIVEYRDQPTIRGFESIGELMNVDEMGYYADDSVDLAGFPDLTTPDGPSGVAEDDFEERDVIFARISNLVTVRSDVFTAYILVRIGTDGPQKRVIAILDRSDVYSGDGKVRIVALHPVPDPR